AAEGVARIPGAQPVAIAGPQGLELAAVAAPQGPQHELRVAQGERPDMNHRVIVEASWSAGDTRGPASGPLVGPWGHGFRGAEGSQEDAAHRAAGAPRSALRRGAGGAPAGAGGRPPARARQAAVGRD